MKKFIVMCLMGLFSFVGITQAEGLIKVDDGLKVKVASVDSCKIVAGNTVSTVVEMPAYLTDTIGIFSDSLGKNEAFAEPNGVDQEFVSLHIDPGLCD
ncbi:hypothetical protein [Lacihabitans soyangensis]|uniref:Uncharacterized protein n=1 Tax=Lacihabitans soyangensis TaxID=869394 RepID=A0AAE3H6V6_9BACT|nr:hypothetical protein [Lacihabitans soyangensis]MCP9765149.1 hypothetical protein [Lacihabitans soyangensis]